MAIDNSVPEVSAVSETSSPTTPIENSVPTAVEEKLVPQSNVNDIVGSVRNKAFHKGYEDAKSEFAQQLAAHKEEIAQLVNNSSSKSTTSKESSSDKLAPLTTENIRDVVAEQFQNHQSEQVANYEKVQQENELRRIFGELSPKVNSAAQKYDDFNDVTNAADFITEAPELLFYANTVDNAGDVLYNLAKNPAKIGALKSLSPRLAQLEIQRLGQSLKLNENGSQTQLPHEPLSQLKSSNIGSDNGKQSLKDLREYYKTQV